MKAQLYSSIVGQSLRAWISTNTVLLMAAAALLGAQRTALASDPIGVFALIDKVVLEPNDTAPERIQVWGAFAVAKKGDRDAYEAPQSGYLYFTLPKEKAETARTEWKDLKATAGTREVIGFGLRYEKLPDVRKSDVKPAEPEPYVVGWGLVKMNKRGADYPPVKALFKHKDAPKTASL